MTCPTRLSPASRLPALLCVTGAVLLGGCQTAKPPQRARPTPTAQVAAPPAGAEQLAVENKGLEEALASERAARKALEEQLARSTARVLERDAQLKEIKDRQSALQQRLDDAILEVVRAKGKLRSLESRAEAASNLAEAEIAVKALAGQPRGGEPGQMLANAEQLLRMSTDEFKKENYGGALYLAIEAKGRLSAAALKAAGRGPAPGSEGESLLAQPLPLATVRACNLREGPGVEFKVVASLPQGARLVAQAHKGQWVRVTCGDGKTGWVFQSLVVPQ